MIYHRIVTKTPNATTLQESKLFFWRLWLYIICSAIVCLFVHINVVPLMDFTVSHLIKIYRSNKSMIRCWWRYSPSPSLWRHPKLEPWLFFTTTHKFSKPYRWRTLVPSQSKTTTDLWHHVKFSELSGIIWNDEAYPQKETQEML
jgi:hypothetical protein